MGGTPYNARTGYEVGHADSIGDCLSRDRLRWLGHLSRMDDDRLPKQILFAEGVAPRPRHGPKKRWRDSVMGDLQPLGVSDGWFVLAQEREQWLRLHSQQQPQPAAARELVCECGRQFRRRNDNHNIGNSAKLNDYHRLRRWVSKGPKVWGGEGGFHSNTPFSAVILWLIVIFKHSVTLSCDFRIVRHARACACSFCLAFTGRQWASPELQCTSGQQITDKGEW